MRSTPTDPGRSPWLELARQQSRSLAEQRADQLPRWRWSALEARGQGRRGVRGIPGWAMALSALAMLLLASGTWAFVRKLRQAPPPPAVSERAAPAAAAEAAKPSARSRRASSGRGVAPEAASSRELQQAPPQPAVKRKPAPSAKQATSAPAAKEQEQQGPIIFGDEMPGGGELIIVSPPPRLEPLWTVEEYKRRR